MALAWAPASSSEQHPQSIYLLPELLSICRSLVPNQARAPSSARSHLIQILNLCFHLSLHLIVLELDLLDLFLSLEITVFKIINFLDFTLVLIEFVLPVAFHPLIMTLQILLLELPSALVVVMKLLQSLIVLLHSLVPELSLFI